jgi:LemA protein
MTWIPLLLLAVVAVVVVWAIAAYNGLVGLRNRVQGAWSDIEVQLKRRHDLVGNLVETVKGYAQHERGTFEAVVQARNQAVGALQGGGAVAAASAENALTGALRQLFALAESYPDLKAASNFLELQHSLEGLEDAIQNARRYYNAVVRDFNTGIQTFPNVLVARSLGFREFDFFELPDASEAEAPQVSFTPAK